MQDEYNPQDLWSYDIKKKYFIVSTEWNFKYVDILERDCVKTLKEKWINNIEVLKVPWSLELPFWALKAFELWADIVIVIWTVIRGETSHYDHVCLWVTKWIMDLQLKLEKPVIYWLLTCNNLKQVEERLYKGREWALSAIRVSTLG